MIGPEEMAAEVVSCRRAGNGELVTQWSLELERSVGPTEADRLVQKAEREYNAAPTSQGKKTSIAVSAAT